MHMMPRYTNLSALADSVASKANAFWEISYLSCSRLCAALSPQGKDAVLHSAKCWRRQQRPNWRDSTSASSNKKCRAKRLLTSGFSEDAIIATVREGLVDESPAVRQAAAQAFDALQTQIGPRSIDQTIPTLLHALTEKGAASEAALSALQEL